MAVTRTEPVVVERFYNVPAEKVWAAITRKEEMKKWYFDLAEFRPEAGFTFQFSGGPPDKPPYVHTCTVTEVIAGQKLAYSWHYEGHPGISLVTFELFPEQNGTRLRLTHEGLESFDQSNPDFDRKNFAEGWNDILGRSLENYLQSN